LIDGGAGEMAKVKKSGNPSRRAATAKTAVKFNPKLPTQQRKTLRTHYFAKYRVR